MQRQIKEAKSKTEATKEKLDYLQDSMMNEGNAQFTSLTIQHGKLEWVAYRYTNIINVLTVSYKKAQGHLEFE